MNTSPHPYDLVFGIPEFEAEEFPGIKQEAEERGVDPRDIPQFIMLATVGALMRSLLPADANKDAVKQFSAVVTHAYHYWLAGKQSFEIDDATLRRLLAPDVVVGSWDMAPPVPAGYVRLPRNVIFARIDETATPEAIDGFFFIMPGTHDAAVPPNERLDALLILGLVPQRGGFSVIDITTTVTAEAVGHFGDVVAREGGCDFENVLPGGEGRLLAVTNTLEVFKLIARCFWHLAGHG